MSQSNSVRYQDIRPSEWEEFIGNEDSVAYLAAKVDDIQRPHNYLFFGPSGCGKTTAARLFSQKLGCFGSDYIEIDGADDRGIDMTRELKKMYRTPPMYGSFRVIVIDEAHQLSKDAKDSALKMLEDIFPSTIIILCTTEPENLKTTLRTRLTPVEFKSLRDEEMLYLLQSCMERSGVSLDQEILEKIVSVSNGSSRYALVLLEKAVSYPISDFSSITFEASAEVIELCRALVKKAPAKAVCDILKKLKGEDSEKIRRAVLGYANSTYLNSQKDIALVILDSFKETTFYTGLPGITLSCMRVIFS